MIHQMPRESLKLTEVVGKLENGFWSGRPCLPTNVPEALPTNARCLDPHRNDLD